MGESLDPHEQRLQELNELFEPPARVSPAKWSARIEEDEEVRNKIRERFERGIASGRFPALSEFFSHLSAKEEESFFKTRGSIARHSSGGLEDSRVRFCQLQQLFLRDNEFMTRYPEAHAILFPQRALSAST